TRRAHAELAELGGHRTVGRLTAARGVREPVLARAVDRGDRLVADDERADVAPRLGDVLLDVIDGMEVVPEYVLVLDDRLRRLAVVDLRDEAAPRADERLHHDGIAQLLDRRERGPRGEGHARTRARHAVADETHRREQLLLDAHAREQDADARSHHSPQSSSASGASARASGRVSFTSSSAPQSGHETISPFTASEPTVTSASHSGHFGD